MDPETGKRKGFPWTHRLGTDPLATWWFMLTWGGAWRKLTLEEALIGLRTHANTHVH